VADNLIYMAEKMKEFVLSKQQNMP